MYPTYPPPSTAKPSAILSNVQPQLGPSLLPLLPLVRFGGALGDTFGDALGGRLASGFAAALLDRGPSPSYRFHVSMRRMSKLSLSSPVSALKPRYETDGNATAPSVKHSVQSPSLLYCSSSLSDSSW